MITNQKDLNIISKKIIAAKGIFEYHNPILMDEKIRRSLFKEKYNTNLTNKKNEATTINLAHALALIGMKNDLGLDEFLKIIKNDLSTSKHHKVKQQNTTKINVKKYAKIASVYFKKNNNLKQYILKKTKPYLQNS